MRPQGGENIDVELIIGDDLTPRIKNLLVNGGVYAEDGWEQCAL